METRVIIKIRFCASLVNSICIARRRHEWSLDPDLHLQASFAPLLQPLGCGLTKAISSSPWSYIDYDDSIPTTGYWPYIGNIFPHGGPHDCVLALHGERFFSGTRSPNKPSDLVFGVFQKYLSPQELNLHAPLTGVGAGNQAGPLAGTLAMHFVGSLAETLRWALLAWVARSLL